MITLDGVHARSTATRGRPASILANVTLTWERGVLAVLGTPADGTTALLEVLAGTLRTRAGRAMIDGRAPADARARMAYVPLEPALPEAFRVEEVCALASTIRGEPQASAASRLAPLGIEKLAERRVRSLSPGEQRAVALAIAITSAAPILLVEEPLAGLDPSAPSRVIHELRERATAGAAVVVTTASVRDATRLADQLGILTRGVFTHLPPSLAHVGPGGARLRVVVGANATTDIAPFVAALGQEAAVASVETAAFAATRVLYAAVAVVVTGPDLLALARAVAVAATKTNAAIEAIESAVMPLDGIRARITAPQPGVIPALPLPPSDPPAPPEGAA